MSSLQLSFSEYSAAYAASIVKAKIVVCPGVTADEVRELLAQALDASRGAQSRLNRLQAKPTEADRAALWNGGPEHTWFAAYDQRKFSSLKNVFDRIEKILSSSRLDVICKPSLKADAEALPGIWKISLGTVWINSTNREERIQTFVHEAAHIAGRTVAQENAWYGKSTAQAQALKRRPLRPRIALRSADNIGYYATDLAQNFLSYM